VVEKAMKADKVVQAPTIRVGRAGAKPRPVAMRSAIDEASVSAASDNALQG